MWLKTVGKLPDDKTPEGYIKVAPDIAVEVVSPNELYEEVEAKVADYRSAGVKRRAIGLRTARRRLPSPRNC